MSPRAKSLACLLCALVVVSLALPLAPGLSAAPAAKVDAPKSPEPPPAPSAAIDTVPEDEDQQGLPVGVTRKSAEKVGFGAPITVAADELIRGDVVCIGAAARVDGIVRGDVVVIGGSLTMSGSARSVVGVGSSLELTEGAKVRADVVNVGGRLEREGAEIGGQVVDLGIGLNLLRSPFRIHSGGFPSLWGLALGYKAASLAIVFFAIIVIAAIVPERIRRIRDETAARLGLAFLAGLLAYVALPVVFFLLAMTIIGIPVAILVYFVFLIFKWIGLAGLFAEIGRRIGGSLFGREMSLLGGIALGFLPFALVRFVPFCVGWTLWFLLEIVAIGLVIVTRAGSPAGIVVPPPPMVSADPPPPPATPPA